MEKKDYLSLTFLGTSMVFFIISIIVNLQSIATNSGVSVIGFIFLVLGWLFYFIARITK